MKLIKLCPKCQAENEQTRSGCWQCYASLSGVPMSESKAPVLTPEPQLQPQPVTVLGMPKGLASALACLLVALLAYAAWSRFGPMPKVPPDKVVLSFLEAKKTHELPKVEAYLSKADAEALEDAFKGNAVKSGLSDSGEIANTYLYGRPPSVDELMVSRIETSVVRFMGFSRHRALVRAKLSALNPELGGSRRSYDFVLVNEGGAWKIDLEGTRELESAGGGVGLPQ